MTDYETLARRVLGCESRERRGRLWCETHDEPWECPRATEVADDLREAWRAEAGALLERLAAAEQSLGRCRCGALLTEDGDWLPLAQRVLCCEWVDDGWCETHDDPWPCGRAREAADVLDDELDQPTKEQKMSNDTPTPIDPADLRPGDVFQVVYAGTCEEIDSAYSVIQTTEGNAFDMKDTDGTWHLVHRPDPDAQAVEAVRSASYNIWLGEERLDPLPGLRESADLLNRLREQGWDVVRRAES